MKVLLVNGSPHEKGCTYTALNEIAGTLAENGIESEIFQIGTVIDENPTGIGALFIKIV